MQIQMLEIYFFRSVHGLSLSGEEPSYSSGAWSRIIPTPHQKEPVEVVQALD